MMGMQQQPESSLFYIGIDIGKRVRENHPLRRVNELIDFDFAYTEVKDFYGHNGNVSVPPPERIDWLWFLGYDLDSTIPNHSVLSKARKRWGVEVFQSFFERVVLQCMEAGLVDGRKIFVDSSLVDADASNNSVIDTRNLKHQLRENYQKLESRLEETSGSSAKKNDRYMSTTDSDAAIVNRGKSKLTYQVHRAVDEQNEIITATEATPGDVNEAHLMLPLLDKHHQTTGTKAQTVVGDSKYGTIENFLGCYDNGIEAHIPDLNAASTAKRKIFSEDQFLYNSESDTYRCPAGNLLKPKSLHKSRQSRDYVAPKKVCAACQLRDQCTKNKSGRTIKRHLRQETLNMMRAASHSAKSKRDIKTRQHLMERSFARSTRYNFDRARWRGLWRMRIQEFLICSIQNIQVLIKKTVKPVKCIEAGTVGVYNASLKAISGLFAAINARLFGQLLPCRVYFQRT